MEQKNKVVVKINGQEYPIVGAEPKEYLLRIGNFVDEKMEAVSRVNKQLSTSMVAVLTSINIADQYLKIKMELEDIKKELKQPEQTVEELEKYIETLHNQLNEKEEAYSSLEIKIEEIKENQQVDTQVVLLQDELLQKDGDLEKAQTLINDLQNKIYGIQMELMEVKNKTQGD